MQWPTPTTYSLLAGSSGSAQFPIVTTVYKKASSPSPFANISITPGSVKPTPINNTTVPADRANSSSNAIILGCILPKTGVKAFSGQAIEKALRLSLLQNKPKSVNVTLLECVDTQCDEVYSTRAMDKLASRGVVAVFGDVCSGSTVAAAAVANAKQTLLISPAATSPVLSKQDYFFRTVPSDVYQGTYAAELVYAGGAKKAAVVYTTSSYGFNLYYIFAAEFTKLSGPNAVNPKTSVFPYFPGTKANYTTLAKQIIASKADAVFFATNDLQHAGSVIKALRAANFTGQLYGGDAIMDPGLLRYVDKKDVRGLLGSDVSFGSRQFQKDYAAYAGNNVSYNAKAAHAYDAMKAVLLALDTAKTPRTSKQVIVPLAKLKFQGVSEAISFDQLGDLPYKANASYNTVEFTPSGSVAIVPNMTAMSNRSTATASRKPL
eukprot:jgi/Chrzof1/2789/Cz11g29140.t1